MRLLVAPWQIEEHGKVVQICNSQREAGHENFYLVIRYSLYPLSACLRAAVHDLQCSAASEHITQKQQGIFTSKLLTMSVPSIGSWELVDFGCLALKLLRQML